MSCERCGGPTKPLFTGVYCVIGCDQKDLVVSPEKPGRSKRTTQCMHQHVQWFVGANMDGSYSLERVYVYCKAIVEPSTP